MKRAFRLALTVALAPSLSAVAGAATYSIEDLGVFTAGFNGNLAVNNLGQVALNVMSGGTQHAAIWSSGNITVLPYIGTGTYSDVGGINDAGQVSGLAHTLPGTATRGVRWSNDGSGYVAAGVGSFDGTSESYGWGINASGVVAGRSSGAAGGFYRAFNWNGTSLTDMGSGGRTGWLYSTARDINDSGQMAGNTDWNSGIGAQWNAALYSAGQWIKVPNLGTGTASGAFGINNDGDVTGYSYLAGASGNYHGFVYSNGVSTDIGSLEASSFASLGRDVNVHDLVVGWSQSASGQKAIAYQGGVLTELNTLIEPGSGWNLIDAQGISDSGYIVGYGSIGGVNHVYLLTPTAVPEPATLAVLGLGVAALLRRRRK